MSLTDSERVDRSRSVRHHMLEYQDRCPTRAGKLRELRLAVEELAIIARLELEAEGGSDATAADQGPAARSASP